MNIPNEFNDYVERNKWSLLRKLNAHTIGIGRKMVNGVPTDDLAIRVGVSKKLDPMMLPSKQVISKTVRFANTTLPTDVIQRNKFYLFENISFEYPMKSGHSVGHRDISAGTTGWFPVVMLPDGTKKRMLHSNNHVLAASNAAAIGDPIYYPGPHDLNEAGLELSEQYHCANLHSFVPIEMIHWDNIIGEYCNVAQNTARLPNWIARLIKLQLKKQGYTGTQLIPIYMRNGNIEWPIIKPLEDDDDPTGTFPENEVDGALAEPIKEFDPEIPNIGIPKYWKNAALDDEVQKHGRTTGYTQGIVSEVNFAVTVQYPGSQYGALMVNCWVVDHGTGEPFGQPGDSGSGVFTRDHNPKYCGKLFAGSESSTIMNQAKPHVDNFKLGNSTGILYQLD